MLYLPGTTIAYPGPVVHGRPVHEPFDVSFNVAQDGVCWTDAVLHADFFSPALPDHSGATNGLFVTNYHPAKVIGCSDALFGTSLTGNFS
jgi:hypothetical protein